MFCQLSDPFGTGLFIPAGGTSALNLPSRTLTASEPPQLPPKQHKRAPAPPRPPAPKPSGGSVPGHLDTFDGSDPFQRGHRSGSSLSSKKNEAFAGFSEFSQGQVSNFCIFSRSVVLLCLCFVHMHLYYTTEQNVLPSPADDF